MPVPEEPTDLPEVELEVPLADGKYTYIRYAGGRQAALRYGEPWPAADQALVGDHFTAALGYKIEDLQREVKELRAALDLKEWVAGLENAPIGVMVLAAWDDVPGALEVGGWVGPVVGVAWLKTWTSPLAPTDRRPTHWRLLPTLL